MTSSVTGNITPYISVPIDGGRSIPTNAGVIYEATRGIFTMRIRGIENHNDGFGTHFNININKYSTIPESDWHITYQGEEYSSYNWRMYDSVKGVETEVVGYGTEVQASENAAYGMPGVIGEVDGPTEEVLAEGGLSVLGDLLLGLLLL